MSGVRVGINPLTWTNDDLPELGGETPLETCLSEARQAGYLGVELGNKFPRDPKVLRPILEQHDLLLVSGWYSAHLLERTVLEERKAMQSHLDLLMALGSTVMVFAETSGAVHGQRDTPLSHRPVLDAAGWRRLCSSLGELASHLADNGMRLAYHHHMGTVIESSEDIERLLASTPKAVGLLLDTGHLSYAGGDPVAMAKTHAERIVHVHLKDTRREALARARAEDQPFLSAVLAGVFTVPGDGSLDYPGVFGALTRSGYSGWWVVEAEQDPSQAHPLTNAKLGYQNVARFAKDAGQELVSR